MTAHGSPGLTSDGERHNQYRPPRRLRQVWWLSWCLVFGFIPTLAYGAAERESQVNVRAAGDPTQPIKSIGSAQATVKQEKRSPHLILDGMGRVLAVTPHEGSVLLKRVIGAHNPFIVHVISHHASDDTGDKEPCYKAPTILKLRFRSGTDPRVPPPGTGNTAPVTFSNDSLLQFSVDVGTVGDDSILFLELARTLRAKCRSNITDAADIIDSRLSNHEAERSSLSAQVDAVSVTIQNLNKLIASLEKSAGSTASLEYQHRLLAQATAEQTKLRRQRDELSKKIDTELEKTCGVTEHGMIDCKRFSSSGEGVTMRTVRRYRTFNPEGDVVVRRVATGFDQAERMTFFDFGPVTRDGVPVLSLLSRRPTVMHGSRQWLVVTNVPVSYTGTLQLSVRGIRGAVANLAPVRPVFTGAATDLASGPVSPTVFSIAGHSPTQPDGPYRDVFLPLDGDFSPNDAPVVDLSVRSPDSTEVTVLKNVQLAQHRARYRFGLTTGVFYVGSDRGRNVGAASLTFYWRRVDIQEKRTHCSRFCPNFTIAFSYSSPLTDALAGVSFELSRNLNLFIGSSISKTSGTGDAPQVWKRALATGLHINFDALTGVIKK